jgi:hypothetical protein
VQSAAAVGLLLLVAFQVHRLLSARLGLKLNLGGRDIAALKPETAAFLAAGRERITLTYFVSSRETMPSSMKGVEEAVRALLRALKAQAPHRLDYRVIDPGLEPKLDDEKMTVAEAYASSRSASPLKVRKVLRDESSEEGIWSSLAIAHGRFSDALIKGITTADLPYLEDLIVEHLKAGESPIRPVIAVASAGESFQSFPHLIASLTNARVVRLDLERDHRIPPEVDVLFWIEPGPVGEPHRDELRRFVDSGRTALVAGSAYSVTSSPGPEGKPLHRVTLSACDWNMLLRPFGLTMIPRLIMDRNHEPISWRQADGSRWEVDAPFQLRVLPSHYTTKSFLGPPAGALVVSGASTLQPEPRLLAAAGLKAEVVATASEHNTILELPAEAFDDELLEAREPAPKQPWSVLVRSEDPWKGELLVVSSSGLFHDDILAQPRNANQVFIRTLLRTYTDGNRLARIRVPRAGPEPLPQLSLAARIAWRGITVFFVPVLLVLLALRVSGGSRRVFPAASLARGAVPLLLCGGLVFLLGAFRGWSWPYGDLTEEKANTPSPLTRKLLDARGELAAELFLSDSSRMPASLKRIERRLLSGLRALGVRFRVMRPEELERSEQDALRAAGIESFEVDSVQDDLPVPVRVWSGLRLSQGGRTAVVPRIDARTILHLEFLLAAAVKRLESGAGPLVGILSDLPRLSPAEAHTDYQQKGYTAPIGSDVYSFAKSLLQQYGYRIAHINPDTPVLPEGMDLFLWLQPRYPVRVFQQFSDYMTGGGKAIVALQHYNVQQRQYRGAGFKTVYWPQPQFHRVNEYLEHIGLRQIGEKLGEEPGEVLFDINRGYLVLETQVNRSAFREHDPQQVARPFLIRALGDGLSSSTPITSRLGELLFIWGSRFRLDEEALRRKGYRREILVTTSPHAWHYPWKGGWIPEEYLAGPQEPLGAAVPLSLLVEGRFPRLELRREEARETLVPLGGTGEKEGSLLLIGCSEMFKNAHLYAPGYQHDQFLLNAVAFLAHGPEMAEIQSRQVKLKSFPFQPPGVKLAWRIAAVGVGPAVFLLCGLLWRLRRRRSVLGARA